MLFSLRSILAVTFLTGLAPLSVFGAPLSQLEDVLERRVLPAGHVVTVRDHHGVPVAHHTLGNPIGGIGSTATVHHVVGRPDLVAKVYHGGSPLDQRKEAENLQQVDEFRGSANSAGHHIVFSQKHHGHTLENTHAWQNASPARKQELKAQASRLVMDKNTEHAIHHGIVHTDANHGNVLYHENHTGLTSAHFVDWGLAKPAAMGPHGQLDSRTQQIINRSGTKAIHGVTR